ncbi:MAG: T9SS type A sorting domain-containing protein, partial [Bacteroidetes bacterium]|nr:T9SS type A sorting domain-containing protein [Bacteroidota bacterium]
RQTFDGGFIIAGETFSFGAGSYDAYLIKMDGDGDTLWTKTYGGTGADYFRDVRETADSGLILVGYTTSYGPGGDDIFLIRTDSMGVEIWSRSYGTSGAEIGNAVEQTIDGGFIITGSTNGMGAGNFDVYLLKTNSSGTLEWSRAFGGTDVESAASVKQLSTGGYIIGGTTRSFGAGNQDAYLIETNSSGDTVWTRTYGTSSFDQTRSIEITADGGFLAAGASNGLGAGGYDIYMVNSDDDGATGGCNQSNSATQVATSGTVQSTASPTISSTTAGVSTPSGISIGTSTVVTQVCALILPIELVSFGGYNDQNVIVLDWTTLNEMNNDHFVIQRSSDALTFEDLAIIDGAGTINVQMNYGYVDNSPNSGVNYYRLKQVDLSGVAKVSEMISITANIKEANIKIVIYPNPTSEYIFLDFQNIERSEDRLIQVFNTHGKEVLQTLIPGHQMLHTLKINLDHLANGVYFIHVRGNGQHSINKVIKRG